MSASKTAGTFSQIVYGPKGGIEGFIVDDEDGPVQFVVSKHDEKAAALASTLSSGQQVMVIGQPAPASDKGTGAHRVLHFQKFSSIDGHTPRPVRATSSGYSGTIIRFNYAKHGAPNGFVLDSGDFIHVKPDGFTKLKLNIGDAVQAEGDAHFLSTGGGWAVEATSVNRRKIK